MKNLGLIMILAVLLLLAGCEQGNKSERYNGLVDNSKPLAQGGDNEVYLFMGLPDMEETVAVIDTSVTRTVKLLYDESYFEISTNKQPEELTNYLKHRNLILCGTLDSPDEVSNYMRRSLASALVDKVKTSGGEFYVNNNVNSRDQIILYLLGANRDSLASLVANRADQIFSTLLERYQKRLAYQAYSQKVLPSATFKGWPFTLQLPEFYGIDKNDPQGSYLSFNFSPEDKPSRYLAVYSEAMPTNQVSSEWLIGKRKALAHKYLDKEEIVGEPVTEETTIAGYKGLRIYGGWANENLYGGVGGAFQAFGFWDARSKRAYLIDNWVYFPAGGKLEPLLELGMLSESIVIR